MDATVASVVSALQVGFAGWVAWFLLTKNNQVMQDLNKNLATLLQLMQEQREMTRVYQEEVRKLKED